MSGSEIFNENFSRLCNMVGESEFLVDAIVYCDDGPSGQSQRHCRYLSTAGFTKFARIHAALTDAKSDFLFFVDNDLQPDGAAFLQFLRECVDAKCDVAWGRIRSVVIPGIVPGMIRADKRLSHDFIRPFLWNMHVGISIPGQLFMMDRRFAKAHLPQDDTLFDDLTIGLAVRMHQGRTYASRSILGYEKPNSTLEGLVRQRCRWAKGFAQVLSANIGKPGFPFIIIHGLAYHFLWILFWAAFFVFFLFQPLLGLLSLFCCTLWLARFTLTEIPFSILYSVVFPFLHFLWFVRFIFSFWDCRNPSKN